MNLHFPIPFTKMSGTGNDFIIIDNRDSLLAGDGLPEFVRAVCRRKFSVGADGLILIENSRAADFSWQFFNADGSLAEMCGNGARCAARFAYMRGIAPAGMRFATAAGLVEASVNAADGNVKIRLTPAGDIRLDLRFVLDGEDRIVHFINTGVPHAVLLVDDVAGVPVAEWGRTLRYHDFFKPAGTNVNFVQVVGEKSLKVRTYERGVEGETMACGTGAVASAVIGAMTAGIGSPTDITTSGGGSLTIHFAAPDRTARIVDPVFLAGPAHFVYDGQLQADAVQNIK